MTQKSKRGGKRPNAGRKRGKKPESKNINMAVTWAERERILSTREIETEIRLIEKRLHCNAVHPDLVLSYELKLKNLHDHLNEIA